MKKEVSTFISLLKNKGIAISLLAVLLYKYADFGDAPFAELIYAVILISTTIVTAPVIRLLVFPESADMAERGSVEDLLGQPDFSPALFHYWFSTAVSYIVTLVCISSLL